ncbi:MAG: SsrA-binding protein SmpB [Candidatus Peribacter sp.]|jgi:SsrA-binding protein|nr:SsrA-binding protein SmpB [Candidatus Peribacter sp.]MBT4393073.1 SsrA-binding protein SmpB [Candidatus Peribacter sp.]MBT4600871.1 SsrA-binding protein SmpB [Candidatus Peribacter sp.]MBT5148998.1 SsrA-binding protein SmpB [Candidatus Peribacter sp.]MBT5638322.1 SsrA-binding protein SmpB [Candidatus Peribacter sp.]
MKTIAHNRRAKYDYDIVDTLEAGITLTGQEVKSCRMGNINLAGAYVSLVSGSPVIKGMKIARYSHASNLESYEPGRDRTLLLNKKEIVKLTTKLAEQGVSLVPLEVKAGKYIKVILGLGKGKKRYDKRQSKKEQDIGRRLKEGRDI